MTANWHALPQAPAKLGRPKCASVSLSAKLLDCMGSKNGWRTQADTGACGLRACLSSVRVSLCCCLIELGSRCCQALGVCCAGLAVQSGQH